MTRVPLLTIYDLLRPIAATWLTVSTVLKRLSAETPDEFTLRGHFVLMMGGFEAMLAELMTVYLLEHPSRLPDSEPKVSKGLLIESFSTSHVLERLVERRVVDVSFGSLQVFLAKFFETLTITPYGDQDILDKLTEFKETRNLVIHNNLVVNSRYLDKAGPRARSEWRGTRLEVSCDYVSNAANCICEVIAYVEDHVRLRFGSLTRLAMLERLWEHTLPTPVAMPFKDFWHIDVEGDCVKGWKDNEARVNSLSHSERIYYQLWIQHCSGNVDISDFHMKRFGDTERLLWFLEKLQLLGLEGG